MYYAMILLAVSIPLSEFGMSISQFLLLGLWIFEGAEKRNSISSDQKHKSRAWKILINLGCKFRMLYNNPAAMVVVSFYMLHLIGIIYTSDLNYALKDLRIKIPLISIPVILATSAPLSIKRFHRLMLFFVFAVFSGTMASMYVLFTRHVADPRELSIFISHIRFSLTICFSVFILIYFIVKRIYTNKAAVYSMIAGVVWLLMFLLILESVTGIMITVILGFIFLFYYISQLRSLALKVIVSLLLLASIVPAYRYLDKTVKEYSTPAALNMAELDRFTEFGAPYLHDTSTYGIENGQYVGLYISMVEMRHEWNQRSSLDFDGKDLKDQELKHTLIRYLHSKGLRKNALAVRSLSDKEIQHIENGIANKRYVEHFNLTSRFEQMAMGYHNYMRSGDPNASSVMQRFEYWKASAHIIKHNWLIGVGTGDLDDAFNRTYTQLDSKLHESFRMRSHNQFLAVFIAFGIFGLLWFIFTLLYPGLKSGKFTNYFYIVFFIIIIMSMLTEDTLETQAGATFFAFFNALLLFGHKRNTDKAEDPG
jgi:hypothetical protein